jgi:LacI family transcriptional regulator
MRNTKRIPIQQVAQVAGVSTQTVSRVINDRPDVSRETRRRVLEVISQLGYRPSRAARALRGTSRTIGVVGFGLEYYGPSRTLTGVNIRAKELDYGLVLDLVQNLEDMDVDSIMERMMADHVDGILWCIPEIGDNWIHITERARQSEIPIVFTDVEHRNGLSTVQIDNYAGGRLAAKHLIDQGHTVLGTVTGPQSYFSARQRHLGWLETLHEYGLTTEYTIHTMDWVAGCGAQSAEEMLSAHPEITGIFAGNDQIALGVFRAARRLGRKIPDDLAVVGYDDIPEAEFFEPALTSVHQEVADLGMRAVTELTRIIDQLHDDIPFTPQTILTTPSLVVRESSITKTSR